MQEVLLKMRLGNTTREVWAIHIDVDQKYYCTYTRQDTKRSVPIYTLIIAEYTRITPVTSCQYERLTHGSRHEPELPNME